MTIYEMKYNWTKCEMLVNAIFLYMIQNAYVQGPIQKTLGDKVF